MIEIIDLKKHFPDRTGRQDSLVLDGIDLCVGKHEFVCIIGPSGCGKTTLLKLIGGLIQPDAGRILIEKKPVSGPGPERGMVFQNFALLPWANVLENIVFGLKLRKMPKDTRLGIANKLIEAVRLNGFEYHYPRELSGGMQQRVGLARALAIDPDILLMDEPFGSVDAQTRRMLQEDLLKIFESSKKTVVFVTHSMSEAVRLGDRIVLISPRPGKIREIIDVNIPRPRPEEADRSTAFVEIKEYLWQRLKEMHEDKNG